MQVKFYKHLSHQKMSWSDSSADNGLDLKAGQAHSIVQEKSQNGMHVHIGQYLLLPSYLDWLKEIDPDGNLVLETQACSWTNKDQFKRLYISFPYIQKFWRKGGCLPLYAVDGTFTTSGKFKHTILFAVSYDAKNKLDMLAYAICDKENEDNWLWFLSKLINNFPGSKCILGDFDKGLQSHSIAELLANNNIKFSRCVRHITKLAAFYYRHEQNSTVLQRYLLLSHTFSLHYQ